MRMLPLLVECSLPRNGNGRIHAANLCAELESTARSGARYDQPTAYTGTNIKQVQEAFVEAWAWLEARGLIVPVTDQNSTVGWRRLSRRAQALASEGNFKAFLSADLLPKELLHSAIREDVWIAFIRGAYDVAVFQSMKQVEVSVRAAGGYGAALVGTDLMRQAFHVDTGPLTDKSTIKAEREARQHLFAGAIGSYKNPQSHRRVNLDDPHEAIEQVILASHLLRIVNSRIESIKASRSE